MMQGNRSESKGRHLQFKANSHCKSPLLEYTKGHISRNQNSNVAKKTELVKRFTLFRNDEE